MKTRCRKATSLFALLAATLVLSAPGSARAADLPLFRVADKNYTLEDVAGLTEDKLREQFRAEIKGMTVKELMRFTSDENQREAAKIPEGQRRAFVEQRAFLDVQQALLRHSLERIITAAIAENIIKDQAVNVEEYYDVDLIRRCVRNQIRFIGKLRTAYNEKEKDESLLEELNRELGIDWNKKYWLTTREAIRREHALQQWGGMYWMSPIYEDVSVKAVLASALVRDAWTRGHYHRKATELAVIHQSTFEVYEVSEFPVDKASLEEFFRSITTQDGVIRERGLIAFVDAVRKFSPTIQLRPGATAGWNLIDETDLAVSPLNRLVEVRPGCYRIVGWQNRFSPERMTAKQKESFDIYTNNYAPRLAAKDYFPEVVIHAKHVHLIRPSVEHSLGIDHMDLVAAEMKKGKYVKKVYSAELFDAYRDARSKLAAFGAKAALLSALDDRKGAQLLVDQLVSESKKNAPKKVQDRYRELVERLAKDRELKIEQSPSSP